MNDVLWVVYSIVGIVLVYGAAYQDGWKDAHESINEACPDLAGPARGERDGAGSISAAVPSCSKGESK